MGIDVTGARRLQRFLLLMCILAVGCTSAPEVPALLVAPTAVPLAATITPSSQPRVTTSASPDLSLTPTLTPSRTPVYTPTPIILGEAVAAGQFGAAETPVFTSNEGDPFDFSGLTAEEIISPLTTVEWRPPPYQVPLAIHPDDHYWMIRPVPSDARNYDLEWYPYGVDVLVPQLAPFRIHHGLDYPNPEGTPVLAASSGTVIFAGPRPSPRDGVNYYGNTIIIKHDWQWQGKEVYTLYAHTLEKFVEVGDYVQQGQLLAGVGGSGVVSGPHLHFEVRVGRNGYYDTRNPVLWIVPYEGYGTLAGRFVDRLGNDITHADLYLIPLTADTTLRRSGTYQDGLLQPDEVWQENFAFGDVPAGRYRLRARYNLPGEGLREVERDIDVLPGRTNYTLIQADFVFVPPPTPTPTPVITGTVGITDTLTLTPAVPDN